MIDTGGGVMPADVQALKKDYLFESSLLFSGLSERREWLVARYQEAAEDRSGGEVTASSFEGSSSNVQFRGSTPEERRTALRQAIEHIDSLLVEEQAAASAPRLFGFRFTDPPAEVL